MNKAEAIALRKQIADVLGISGDKPFTATTAAGTTRGELFPAHRYHRSRQWSAGWLHLRFDDPHAGYVLTHGVSNPRSGKCNLHYGSQAVDELRQHLALIQFREVIEQ